MNCRKKKRDGKAQLVVVLVAHRRCNRVHHVPDLHVGHKTVEHNGGIEGKRGSSSSSAVDVRKACAVGVLPDAEVAVDHAVVEPEDWVTGGSIHIAHDTADTVVAVGVSTLFGALGEVLVVLQLLAAVDDVGVDVDGVAVVVVTGEAVVLVSGALAGADVQGEVGELLDIVS